MTQWMQQLLWHSLTMSAIVLAYYAATVGLRKRYATKWFYLIGVILLVGFLIPFRPVVTVEMSKMPDIFQAAAIQEVSGQPSTPSDALTAREAAKNFPWNIAFILWAFGALATVLVHGVKHMRFARAVERWCVDVKDARLLAQFEEAKRSLMMEGRDVGFALCACVHSPMLLRLGKPTVVLPEEEKAAYDLRFILLHELVHCKRKDILCRLVMLLSTAIHWFNPAIYLLNKLVVTQCEISCDERVVENQDMEDRHQYAMSIIGVARCHAKGYTLLTTYFNGGKDTMKKRINSVYEPAKRKAGVLLLACALLLTLLAGTSVATSIAADAGEAELKYTLPENPVKFNEKLDSYIVSWEPVGGIKEYMLGVILEAQFDETVFRVLPMGETEPVKTVPSDTYFYVTEGWAGSGFVADSAGNAHEVALSVWDSITLPGSATKVDISDLINKHLEPKGYDYDPDTFEPTTFVNHKALLSCKMLITAVRETGEPFVVTIEIPIE